MEESLSDTFGNIKLGTRQVEEATGISRYRLHVLASENLIPFTRTSDKTQSNILIAMKDLPAVVEADKKRYSKSAKSSDAHRISDLESQVADLSSRVDTLTELVDAFVDRATAPASTSTP